MTIPPPLVIINVSGGAGSGKLNTLGNVIGVGAKGPNGAVFDVEMFDGDGFPIWGQSGLSDLSKISVDLSLFHDTQIFITNATQDGEYKLKFWYV